MNQSTSQYNRPTPNRRGYAPQQNPPPPSVNPQFSPTNRRSSTQLANFQDSSAHEDIDLTLASPLYTEDMDHQTITGHPSPHEIPSFSKLHPIDSSRSPVRLPQTPVYLTARVPSGEMGMPGVAASCTKAQELYETIIPDLISQVELCKEDNKREFDQGIDFLTKQIDKVQTLQSDFLVPAWYANISTIYRLNLPDGIVTDNNEAVGKNGTDVNQTMGMDQDEDQTMYGEEIKSYFADLISLEKQNGELLNKLHTLGTIVESVVEPVEFASGSQKYDQTILTLDNIFECCDKILEIKIDNDESEGQNEPMTSSAQQYQYNSKQRELGTARINAQRSNVAHMNTTKASHQSVKTHAHTDIVINKVLDDNNDDIVQRSSNTVTGGGDVSDHLDLIDEEIENVQFNRQKDPPAKNHNNTPSLRTPDTIKLTQNSETSTSSGSSGQSRPKRTDTENAVEILRSQSPQSQDLSQTLSRNISRQSQGSQLSQ